MNGLDPTTLAKLLGVAPADKRAQVQAKVSELINLASEHFNTTLTNPEIRYDLKGHVAGRANAHIIRVNLDLLLGEHGEDMLNKTIPHEVAHVVQLQLWPTSKSHGHKWQEVMHLFGLPATRCHNYETTAARKRSKPYIYYCACGEHPVSKTLHKRMVCSVTPILVESASNA